MDTEELFDQLEEESEDLGEDEVVEFDVDSFESEDGVFSFVYDTSEVPERKAGVMFDKARFTALLAMTRDPNISKGKKERVWNTICTEFYFPLVRKVLSRLSISLDKINPWTVVSHMWEKSDKFDLSRKTSPLAYFWQMAYQEIITLNTHANMYPVRAQDIRIKKIMTQDEIDDLELYLDYRILSVKAKPNGKYQVIYQHIDPVSWETDEIEDENQINPEDKVEFINNDHMKAWIRRKAPTKYISNLSIKFYSFLLDYKKIRATTETKLWLEFIRKRNKSEPIKKADRQLIIQTLKEAAKEITHG